MSKKRNCFYFYNSGGLERYKNYLIEKISLAAFQKDPNKLYTTQYLNYLSIQKLKSLE